MRSSKDLVLATRPYAQEQRWRSWWHLWSTVAILSGLSALARTELPWLVRVPIGIVAGLVLVRMFILYHDQQHGAILARSRVAAFVMQCFGLLFLNPPSVWKRSHDHHHHNNTKGFGQNVGSYPLMTTEAYAKASRWTRFKYLASRHPVLIFSGYLTVFFFGMTVVPFLANARRHFDAGVSLVIHFMLLGFMAYNEVDDLLLALILPFTVGSGLGAYLFYQQHNCPGVQVKAGAEWDYASAALYSSSYTRMSPLMHWFTGNIGYHHVHHLNSRIPFYRLPEAMAAIPELQSPTTISLRPRDVVACLRLKLWDAQRGELVPVPKDLESLKRPRAEEPAPMAA